MEADQILEQLSARLPPEQRAAAQAAYAQRAKDGTAAFLTCYFLGLIGAHRIYLGDWTGAALRLLVPMSVAFIAAAGLLDLVPPVGALFGAGALLLVGLVWEMFDLTRIDREVAQRNLVLAKSLVGESLVATSLSGGSRAGASQDSTGRVAAWPVAAWPAGASSAGLTTRPGDLAGEMALGSAAAASSSNLQPSMATRVAPHPRSQPWMQPAAELQGASMPNLQAQPGYHPSASAYPQPSAPMPVPAPPPAFEPNLGPNWEPITEPLPVPTAGQRLRESTQPRPGSVPTQPRLWDAPPPTVAPATDRAIAAGPEPSPAPSADVREPVRLPPVTTPPPEVMPAGSVSRPMKRIRVKRRVVVDGEIVGEQVIEELVPMDVDTQAAAAALRARLAQMTPEQVAALAHLPPGAPIELREGAAAKGY